MDKHPQTPGTPATPAPASPGGALTPGGLHPSIQPAKPAIGTPEPPAAAEADENQAVPVVDSVGPPGAAKKITAFEVRRRHADHWNRTPNATGSGAIHVRTFHSKLTDDALAYLDQCVNEWLDAHPEYEVKLVSSTVGQVTGKLKEPHLICQVWV